MRIALVITELDPGGAELCLTELALYLAQHGHHVQVWSIGATPPLGREGLLERLTNAGIAVRFGEAAGMRDALRIMRWLRRELATFAPDIVQSMLWHANVMTAGALWFSSIPWVAGMRVSEPRSGRWWLERLASRRMQRLVCVSHDVYQHALHRQRIARDKLVIIPNGVPPQLLSDPLDPVELTNLPHSGGDRSTSGTRSQASQGLGLRTPAGHALLFVGRFESQKGILPLMEHVPSLLAGHEAWSMWIVGDGSLRPAIEAKIQSLNIEQQVYMAGWQPKATRWMMAADLLLLPAEYEGMPNVLLEAMAVGKPFVAFAVDGVRQLVDAADGYSPELADLQLAPAGNWSEFARRVRLHMERADLREKCGQANRQHVTQHFRLEDQLAKYLQLYEGLLKG